MNDKLGILIGTFITVLVGIILLQALANNNYNNKTLQTITQDNFTMVNNTCVQITNGCIQSVAYVVNITSGNYGSPVGSGNYSICNAAGSATGVGTYNGIVLSGTDAQVSNWTGQTFSANYTESTSCQYVGDTTSRTLLDLTILLFVIALVIGAIAYLKYTDIFNF